jgi:hypothetical protein
MIITFKFDIDDKVLWKNPHDVEKRIKEGVITAQVRRKRTFTGISMEYYANFKEDPFMNIVCNEEDLLPHNTPMDDWVQEKIALYQL